MPQLHLPCFSNGTTDITPTLSFAKFEETVTYFHHGMPIFSHGQADRASFLVAAAQLHVTCGAKQAAIARAFGVPQITIKRAVKLFRAAGAPAFYAPRVGRGPAVLTDSVLEQAQSQLDTGHEPRMVADLLGIKPDTLSKAIRAGRLRKPVKKKTPAPAATAPRKATSSPPEKRAAKASGQART